MGNSIIEVKNLKKYYRIHQKEAGLWGSVKSLVTRAYYDVKAVDGVSFDIQPGELIGFIGPNGAGKTSTLKVLSGLLYPTSGEVKVLGYQPFKRQAEFQKQFSLVMGQKNQLWWDLPAWESFTLNKQIYDVPDSQFEKIVGELSEMLDVQELLKIQVRKLSLGQRMKVELIAALIHSPKVLFLDEPTIGLDVIAQQKMREFIKEYNQKYQATVILTSHYMNDVKALCERVIIIDHGQVIYDGLLENIIKKFAPYKILNVLFDGKVNIKKIKEIGEVVEQEGLKFAIQISRPDATKQAAKLLNKFDVADLTIEEPPIEDIIRKLFNEHSSK